MEERRPVCPHCGSYEIDYKWVAKLTKPKFIDIPFSVYAEQLKNENQTWFGGESGGFIHLPQLSDYRQLVIQCKKCGYTEVYDLTETKEEKKEKGE